MESIPRLRSRVILDVIVPVFKSPRRLVPKVHYVAELRNHPSSIIVPQTSFNDALDHRRSPLPRPEPNKSICIYSFAKPPLSNTQNANEVRKESVTHFGGCKGVVMSPDYMRKIASPLAVNSMETKSMMMKWAFDSKLLLPT